MAWLTLGCCSLPYAFGDTGDNGRLLGGGWFSQGCVWMAPLSFLLLPCEVGVFFSAELSWDAVNGKYFSSQSHVTRGLSLLSGFSLRGWLISALCCSHPDLCCPVFSLLCVSTFGLVTPSCCKSSPKCVYWNPSKNVLLHSFYSHVVIAKVF